MLACMRLWLLSWLVIFLVIISTDPGNAAPPATNSNGSPAKRVATGPNVWLEIDGNKRRVQLDAEVCLREGGLEQLLCRKNTKEHEAILHLDADARDIHTALLLAGAKPGSTVRYEPKFEAPSGSAIRIQLQFEEKGRTMSVPAGDWVRNIKTKKALDLNWVFAGSQFAKNQLDPNGPPLYAANGGDVICVSNFEDAMLDLPIPSSNDDSELSFEAFTERIPPVGTPVRVILEPIPAGNAPGR